MAVSNHKFPDKILGLGGHCPCLCHLIWLPRHGATTGGSPFDLCSSCIYCIKSGFLLYTEQWSDISNYEIAFSIPILLAKFMGNFTPALIGLLKWLNIKLSI